MTQHQIVPRDEWITARKELLRKEKDFTRLRDQLNAERRALPWVKVEKEYLFDTPSGRQSLGDLFDLVRIFFVHHVTWSVNSVCHFLGSRRFEVDDQSTNVFWLALPSLGEVLAPSSTTPSRALRCTGCAAGSSIPPRC